jgi:Pyridoxamine 5'-phosphate oxidase
MKAQEIAGELGQPGAQQLLRETALARLAYNGPDGLPRVIPTGFQWQHGRVYCCTADTAPKVAALSARPDVALTIDTDDARSLSIRGRAEIEIVDGIPPEYLAASAKTMDAAAMRDFEAQVRATYPKMARIAITPGWARFYDFGAGRLPAFLSQLVAGQ